MSILKEKKNQEIIQEINEKIKPRRFEDIVIRSKGHPRFAMYINAEMNQTDVSDLDLTVRSYNCLKRAGLDTVGKRVEGIDGYQDLLRMRNLGKNSAEEIMIKLFLYQYTHLKPERQVRFLKRFEELN